MDETTAHDIEQRSQIRQFESTPRKPLSAAQDARQIDLSVIMPTIFWTGTFERCARRVLSLLDATNVNAEVVFVFDGAPLRSPRGSLAPM